MSYTKQVKAANILNNGFSSSYPGGDGVALFATNHPLVSGGVNSNEPSTPADLNETSLEAAVIQIAAWTDERGLLIAAKPRKLVVPPALMFVATRILETELRVGTADNDINATPKGVYQFDLGALEAPEWLLRTLPTKTDFAGSEQIQKEVGFLNCRHAWAAWRLPGQQWSR